MAKPTSEPLPSHAMPARKAASRRKGLVVGASLLVGLIVFLFFSDKSFLHGVLLGDIPFSWDDAFASLKDYGYLLFTIYVTLTAVFLFFENRNPDRTLAWLLVLALLPVVGFILYWIVGPNFRYIADKRRLRLAKPPASLTEMPARQINPLVTDTAHLLYRCSGARLVAGGDVVVFYDGKDAFTRIKECLRGARRSILLESYIIKNDALGNEIKDILIERAQCGVCVCVVYDAVGSWRMGGKFLQALRNAGVHARAFLPVAFPMFRGANYRNHRKILIVDGERAFVGGLNIGDEYVSEDLRFAYWRDTHMEVCGQAAVALRSIFLNDFSVCGASSGLLAKVEAAVATPEEETVRRVNACFENAAAMQIVAGGPDTPWDTIQKGYFSVISRAREKVWLTTPYLVPGDALMEALCASSLSGVDVRLLLPGKADHPLVHWASMHCCDELLRAGVRIFLYDAKGFVHAKTLVADGVLLSVGTANLDTRSLQINFEVQAFIYNTLLAQEMEEAFERDVTRSVELAFTSWRNRSRLQRVGESVGKLFSSLL